MDWKHIQTEDQFQQILEESSSEPILLFKHSNTCPISQIAQERLQQSWDDETPLPVYEIDVHDSKELSQKIAEELGVKHESPQVILISDGKSIYDASHLDIIPAEIESQVDS